MQIKRRGRIGACIEWDENVHHLNPFLLNGVLELQKEIEIVLIRAAIFMDKKILKRILLGKSMKQVYIKWATIAGLGKHAGFIYPVVEKDNFTLTQIAVFVDKGLIEDFYVL